MKDGLSIPMCFRLATEADVKPDGKVQSRWLWRGGAPPKPPPRRRAAAAAAPVGGKRRRRGRGGGGGDEDGEEGGEGDMDFAVEKPTGDLRDALKRHRAEAPPAAEGEAAEGGAEGAAAAGAEGGDGAADAMDGAGAPDADAGAGVDAPLPPGDLRTALLSPPDFGDDPAEAGDA
jgi:hypothetical protein